jgi:uncharacterized membrane protein YgdD (TMEM256/DUF423 family)
MNLVGGAVFAFFAVAFGAFGAHGLKSILDEYSLNIWQTAVSYQFVHALGLLIVGVMERDQPLRWIGRFFCVGILLFSGSLYLLALTGTKWLGAITPFGGLCFLVGWTLLALQAWKRQTK